MIKIIHIIAGGIALLTGLGAILYRHKTKIHKRIGKIYFWCMSIIFVSAVFMSLVKINLFLLCIAFFSYYAALTAYRSLQLKKLHIGQKPEKLDWLIEFFFGLMHFAFVGFALYLLLNNNSSFGTISLVFGLIGLRSNYTTIKRLRGQITEKAYWLMAHVSGMIASYIATITAFTVNNNQWIGMPNIVAWLGPTILLVPFIFYEIGKLKNKTV
jgi:hypothetical protein